RAGGVDSPRHPRTPLHLRVAGRRRRPALPARQVSRGTKSQERTDSLVSPRRAPRRSPEDLRLPARGLGTALRVAVAVLRVVWPPHRMGAPTLRKEAARPRSAAVLLQR